MTLVQPGLEVLLQDQLDLIQGKRVGVIVHPSSIDPQFQHTLDLFLNHPEIELTTVMGPQHGIRGETQDNMIEWKDYRDPVSHLPVYSLYSETRSPTEKMLAEVDVVVVDLQDIGARYYTFISHYGPGHESLPGAREVSYRSGSPQPPLTAIDVEGTVLDHDFSSYVGLYPLAIRHGMTVGELALYFNTEFRIQCELHVVQMRGWTREMFFEETELPWVLPSPNIPSVDTAIVYPGMCLLEGTNVSEGRGTTRPFEISGAPWVQPLETAKRLKQMDLPGAVFRPTYLTPTFHKWASQMIGGIQIHVVDRRAFQPFRTGLALLIAYREMGGTQFQWKKPPYEYEYERLPFDILCGTDEVRKKIEAEASLEEIEHSWQDQLQKFGEVRQKYLLY